MGTSQQTLGKIVWQDLTIENAEEVSRFYSAVAGWKASPHEMSDYQDFNMKDAEGNIVAGICHAKGKNASLPPQWLLYTMVEDVKASAEKCRELGGEVLDGPRMMGDNLFCVIKDPAGAVMGLIQQ